MPKMTHWRVSETIDVPSGKAPVYAAQGWVALGVKSQPVDRAPSERVVSNTVTRALANDPSVERVYENPPTPTRPAKKAAAKKAAKKAVKKS